jgi:hypothetical protein
MKKEDKLEKYQLLLEMKSMDYINNELKTKWWKQWWKHQEGCVSN